MAVVINIPQGRNVMQFQKRMDALGDVDEAIHVAAEETKQFSTCPSATSEQEGSAFAGFAPTGYCGVEAGVVDGFPLFRSISESSSLGSYGSRRDIAPPMSQSTGTIFLFSAAWNTELVQRTL